MKKEAKEYLHRIAERLYEGHASVLVGAGFSKNAQIVPGGVMPADWNELGNLFFEKTRKRKPTNRDLVYANVLRLAEDVENIYERPELSLLIKRAVNDDKLFPSDVHMRLLSLPWKDVYTTNYDTLLERAASRLNEQGRRYYSVILDDASIGLNTSPFLMKLHGDINDPQSIVITEEDYRTYPSKHPAMINHIRNTIMLETVVLVGFSGNDPNFLQWLGWVKDALKKNQRKVYLLSLEEVSDATKKSFEKKNVIVVDLKGCAGKSSTPNEDISEAIDLLDNFIKLRDQQRKEFRNKALAWGRASNREESIEILYKRWRKERETYPGWLVMPREKREYWANFDSLFLEQDKLAKLHDSEQLLFLDLFNWRIEKSLFPIENKWETIYLSVLNRFRPFSHRSRREIKLAWVNLKLGLLRLYRQEGWREKWNSLKDELTELRDRITEDQRSRFDYEQALEAIYRNDFEMLSMVLANWKESTVDAYWDIRKGALWAEYLSLDEGRTITQKAFNSICDKLDAAKEEPDRFYWASRKVHAHTVWECMAQANFSVEDGVTSAARQTWAELKPYDDIWYEREFFDSNVRSIEDTLKTKTTVASFQLGSTHTINSISENARDYRIAYAYFLYYEEAGFPIHLPFLISVDKTTLEKALSVMGFCSLPIAECWLFRAGDSKLVSAVFNRRFLERTSHKDVNVLYARYLVCFEYLLKSDIGEGAPSWVLVYRNVLPEVLSRLCMKASYESRVKTWEYIDEVFKSKRSIHYEGIDRLISSLVSSFSNTQIQNLIPRFVSMPIANDRFGDCRLEPLFYIHGSPILNPDLIGPLANELLNRLGKNVKEDKAILHRLIILNKCNVLSASQASRLAEVLWSKVDESGFPQGTFYSRFAFLSIPHPNNIDPQRLLREYFIKTSLPVVGAGNSFSFYGGTVPLFNDIKGTTNSDIHFEWDTDLINSVCSKLIKMWDTDKHHLLKNDNRIFGYSIHEELRGRFAEVESIIVGVISPNLFLVDNKNKQDLKIMATEFESYGMPSLRLRLALATILDGSNDPTIEISERLGSHDERIIEDSIKAIIYLNRFGSDVKGWVEKISEYFRGNVELGRFAIIDSIRFFITQGGYLDFGSILSNILIGLNRIFEATTVLETDNELEANNKLNLRKLVAPIVRCLLRNNTVRGNKVLLKWQSYFDSAGTSWDIQNSFFDE